mgnify:FL=1
MRRSTVVVDVLRRRGKPAAGEDAGGVGKVMVREPAVQATIVGDPLVRGKRVSAVLHKADVATSTVEFRLSGAQPAARQFHKNTPAGF